MKASKRQLRALLEEARTALDSVAGAESLRYRIDLVLGKRFPLCGQTTLITQKPCKLKGRYSGRCHNHLVPF